MKSQPRKQTIAIHILPNISKSKGNQTTKLSQLKEYNMRNIFLERSYTKCDGETSLRPFSKFFEEKYFSCYILSTDQI